MRRWFFAALAGSVLLAGCQSKNEFLDAPKALDKMSPEELCGFYTQYRQNPELTPQAREVATRNMRAKGCPT